MRKDSTKYAQLSTFMLKCMSIYFQVDNMWPKFDIYSYAKLIMHNIDRKC